MLFFPRARVLQLGMGSMEDSVPSSATTPLSTYPFVNLGTGRSASDVSLGWGHTCALMDNARIKCWGDNGSRKNRLGLGSQINNVCPCKNYYYNGQPAVTFIGDSGEWV